MSKEKTTPKPEAKKPAPNVIYQMPKAGATVGKSGQRYDYAAGALIEAADGELDHVGSSRKLSVKEAKEITEGK